MHVAEAFLIKTINNIKKYKIKNSLQELTFNIWFIVIRIKKKLPRYIEFLINSI